jgi:hypothetical protein
LEHGGAGTETFVLYRARGSDDVAIVAHTIGSNALVQ